MGRAVNLVQRGFDGNLWGLPLRTSGNPKANPAPCQPGSNSFISSIIRFDSGGISPSKVKLGSAFA